MCSSERRLERFLRNARIDTQETWDDFLSQSMPYFRQEPMRLVIDLTSYEEHAQVISIGLLQHSRVLPLVWMVMPGQTKWDQIKDYGSVLSSYANVWLPTLAQRTVP